MTTKPILLSIAAWCCTMLCLTAFVQHQSFFWDTVMLASMQAQWFYTQGFVPFPADIDVGHPPLLPAYLALVWHIFGKSLSVSHWSMMPFLVGIVLIVHRLSLLLFPPAPSPQRAILCASFVLLQPTLLAQSSLISPDVLLVCFFCAALATFVRKRNEDWSGVYALALTLLAFTSLRGVIAIGALFCAECVVLWLERPTGSGFEAFGKFSQGLMRCTRSYLPAAALFLAWYAWHRATTGAIGWHNPQSTEFYRSLSDGAGLVKNYAVFVWRLLDFGMIAVWVALGTSVYAAYRRNLLKSLANTRLVVLFGMMLFVWLPVIAVLPIFSIGHRYFLPLTTLLVLCTASMLAVFTLRLKRWLYAALCVLLLTGHAWAWLYPPRVAKGWDSTLAYLPYDALRKEMMQKIAARGIKPSDIGSRNCAVFSTKYLDLANNPISSDAAFTEQAISQSRYVFFASVLNGFSDEELRQLQGWECVERCASWGIVVELRKNPILP
jgi:hypothetical protein